MSNQEINYTTISAMISKVVESIKDLQAKYEQLARDIEALEKRIINKPSDTTSQAQREVVDVIERYKQTLKEYPLPAATNEQIAVALHCLIVLGVKPSKLGTEFMNRNSVYKLNKWSVQHAQDFAFMTQQEDIFQHASTMSAMIEKYPVLATL